MTAHPQESLRRGAAQTRAVMTVIDLPPNTGPARWPRTDDDAQPIRALENRPSTITLSIRDLGLPNLIPGCFAKEQTVRKPISCDTTQENRIAERGEARLLRGVADL